MQQIIHNGKTNKSLTQKQDLIDENNK